MKLFRFASALAISAVVAGTAASAYTLAQASRPKEYPPSSYTKDVYVDSRGCVYVRANIGTAVNWVPRLAGDRKTVICNATPTSGAALRSASVPPPPPPPPPAPMEIATATTATTATTAAAAAQARGTTPLSSAVAGLRAPTRSASASTASTGNSVSRTLNVTCPSNGSTARVRIGGSTVAVNCDPTGNRAQSYLVRHGNGETTRLVANPAPRREVAPVRNVTTTTRSLAGQVINPPISDGRSATLAEAGLRAVGDHALVSRSPRVQIGNVAPGGATNNFGKTYGVLRPGAVRQGVIGTTGARAATGYSGSTEVQPRGSVSDGFANGYGLAPVQGGGRVVIPSGYRPAWQDGRLNPQRGPRTVQGNYEMASVLDISTVPMVDLTREQLAERYVTGTTVVVSSKNTRQAPVATAAPQVARASATAAAAVSGKRYVQVGAYRDAANASAAAARLKALGLPGRVARTQSGLTVVIAGPYTDAGALANALATARRSFPDAYLRG